MRDDNERIKVAQWVLERTLAAIGAAEVKLSIIITLNLAMLASLGGAFAPVGKAIEAWTLVFLIITSLFIILSLISCANVLIPRMQGPERSIIFFGRIGKKPQKEYFTEFTQVGEEALLDDLLAQVHINSKIACEKYKWIRISMVLTFVSVMPWFVSIVIMTYR